MSRVRFTTEYLVVDVRKCTACGRCAQECRSGVLEVRGGQRALSERRVHFINPDACTGCLACVRVCDERAIKGRGSITG